MARSLRKGPFADSHILKHVARNKANRSTDSIRTRSRRSTIFPAFVGINFLVHNGRKFIPVYVTESMIGHKLGEFSFTRRDNPHRNGNKKAKK
ncbi:30S ribosomal protein S19 [Candidatus Cytomitobacter indipagum]|uniref:Small ribosomal subunit protein uS19 n=1 Tax=Candidatus Cytomitobacter indipagum TaxID=2601575 RepID=A0A5C0UF71_9PROT|nr:30S ribosomal protein S19 [Candidatus Cytomitobacter indipagum]QEK38283.1 30S ribosomal protein S19 [Candidatus Cytomitobacter indipagum]